MCPGVAGSFLTDVDSSAGAIASVASMGWVWRRLRGRERCLGIRRNHIWWASFQGDPWWSLGGSRTRFQDVGAFFAYFILPTGIKGQTVGKWIMGIKVVRRDGSVPGITAAISREMAGKFISAVALGMGFVSVIFDAQHQGWYDRFVSTYVVNRPQPASSWRKTLWGKLAGSKRRSTGNRQE